MMLHIKTLSGQTYDVSYITGQPHSSVVQAKRKSSTRRKSSLPFLKHTDAERSSLELPYEERPSLHDTVQRIPVSRVRKFDIRMVFRSTRNRAAAVCPE